MIYVPASTLAELLVDSYVVCVAAAMIAACVVIVIDSIAVPVFSALCAAFVSSQEGEEFVAGCKRVYFEVVDDEEEEEPEVIEVMDDEDDEVSSDEEGEDDDDDDEVICLGTISPATTTTAAVAAPTSPLPKKKTVSFGNVQVQEYSATLGDHPCCEHGYPISLDWAHTEPKEYDMDWYDETRSTGECAELSAEQRVERIAKVAGISLKDVQKQERTRLWKVQAEEIASRTVLRKVLAASR
jgi:hypothetical protein